MLVRKPTQYQAIAMDPRLAKSLLIRLYFFDGAGLKIFKPILHESDLPGRTEISLFEVDWTSLKQAEPYP